MNLGKIIEVYGTQNIKNCTKSNLKYLEVNIDFTEKLIKERGKLADLDVDLLSNGDFSKTSLYDFESKQDIIRTADITFTKANKYYNKIISFTSFKVYPYTTPEIVRKYLSSLKDRKKIEKLIDTIESKIVLAYPSDFIDRVNDITLENLEKLKKEVGYEPKNVLSLLLLGATNDLEILEKIDQLEVLRDSEQYSSNYLTLSFVSELTLEEVKNINLLFLEYKTPELAKYYNIDEVSKDLIEFVFKENPDIFKETDLKMYRSMYAPAIFESASLIIRKTEYVVDEVFKSIGQLPVYYSTEYLFKLFYSLYCLGFNEEEVLYIAIEDLKKNLFLGEKIISPEAFYLNARFILEGIPNMSKGKFRKLVELYAIEGQSKTLKEFKKVKYKEKDICDIVQEKKEEVVTGDEIHTFNDYINLKVLDFDPNFEEKRLKFRFGFTLKEGDREKIDYVLENSDLKEYDIYDRISCLNNYYYLVKNGYNLNRENSVYILRGYEKETLDLIIAGKVDIEELLNYDLFTRKDYLKSLTN